MGIFNSSILDIVIGVVFVYLTLAILCTAANEWVAALTKRRGNTLKRGITQILADQPIKGGTDPQAFVEEFYKHPLITKMHDDGRHPAYLSARNFAAAVTDVVINSTNDVDNSSPNSGSLQTNVKALPDGQVKKSLLALLQRVNHADQQAAQQAAQQIIEGWFNDSMDRVSGWYKRRTQLWTIIIAAALTVLTNADTIHIVQQLRRDPVLRTAVVEQAKARAQKPRPAVTVEYRDEDDPTQPTITRNEGNQLSESELTLLGQMLGWHRPFWANIRPETFLGWILTVLAVSMGAPFWFDLLNKIMRVRFAGNSPDETSRKPEKPDAEPRA